MSKSRLSSGSGRAPMKALNSLKEDLKVNFDPDEQYEKIKEICRVAYDISYGLYNQFKCL